MADASEGPLTPVINSTLTVCIQPISQPQDTSRRLHLGFGNLCQHRILLPSHGVEAVRRQSEREVSVEKIDKDAPYLVGIPRNLEVPGEIVD